MGFIAANQNGPRHRKGFTRHDSVDSLGETELRRSALNTGEKDPRQLVRFRLRVTLHSDSQQYGRLEETRRNPEKVQPHAA